MLHTCRYLAATHANSIASPTFKTIKHTVNTSTPELIVLEGFSNNNNDLSPKWFLNRVGRCKKSEFKKCGEPTYAAMIAHENGIPFVGGEPSDIEIYHDLKHYGYQEIDILGFYLLRQIPQLKRLGKLKTNGFQSQGESLLANFASDFNFKSSPSFATFLRWYNSHRLGDKEYLDFTTMDVAPSDYDGASYFQKMSARIGVTRERFINTVLNDALKNYSNILIIYGAGHLVKSRKVYEKAFGQSENLKVF